MGFFETIWAGITWLFYNMFTVQGLLFVGLLGIASLQVSLNEIISQLEELNKNIR